MADSDPWPEMKKQMIEQLAKSPKPKPDWKAIYRAKQRRDKEAGR